MAAKAAFAGLYRRADSPYWWIWVRALDENGAPAFDARGKPKRKPLSTGVPLEDKAKADSLLAQVIRQQATKQTLGVRTVGPVTLADFGKRWLARRRAAGMAGVFAEESHWRTHLQADALVRMPLADVRTKHLREFIEALQLKPSRKGGLLAPRTIHNVYAMLHSMFGDAVDDELIDASPATLTTKRRQLPVALDKDPTWRAQAVFTRGEVEALISDLRIPEYRRALYAVLFLTGARFGEAADRRVRDYDDAVTPLGRLIVSTSYSGRMKKSKRTKTGATPNVPVHPTLARVLSSWLGGGWERMAGRPPTPMDLLLPSEVMERHRNRAGLDDFYRDLDMLGMRRRRLHDARRTFITLSIADGASKDLLRWVTHGPSKGAMSLYESPPWDALCREVGKLNIGLKSPPATPVLRVVRAPENTSNASELEAPPKKSEWGRSPSRFAVLVRFRAAGRLNSRAYDEAPRVSCGFVRSQRSNVTPDESPDSPESV